MRIFELIKRCVGFNYTHKKQKEKEKEQERIKRSIQTAVELCQESRFITREDLEKIREENLKHDFTKSR